MTIYQPYDCYDCHRCSALIEDKQQQQQPLEQTFFARHGLSLCRLTGWICRVLRTNSVTSLRQSSSSFTCKPLIRTSFRRTQISSAAESCRSSVCSELSETATSAVDTVVDTDSELILSTAASGNWSRSRWCRSLICFINSFLQPPPTGCCRLSA